MKKLFNKRFILILGSTITLLVILAVAMVFLTKENTKTFTREGYIIASSKEESNKYYFEKGTSYKQNINSELVFTDTTGQKVNVETDNFLHYTDGGIKFLKNGVIMDLENIQSNIVPYYNITNKSLLEYSKKSYYIETIDKTLVFNNLIGRISDNKYIVAGTDIRLQLAGNNSEIIGDYFEITFIEDGVIKVENKEVSYQTTAENSYILSGENIKLDLGTKKVYYGEEEKMSITQMTIDGNENIEIIPTEEEKNDLNNGNNDDNDANNNGTPNDNQNIGNNNDNQSNENGENQENNGENNQDNETDNPNEGSNGGTGSGTGTYKKSASVELVAAEVGLNSINTEFYISDPDNMIQGELLLYITNADTGKRVESDLIDKTQKKYTYQNFTLAPNTNYILSINEENDNGFDTQYFQKLFRTDNFGISLEKQYVTSDSIAYKVIFEEDSKVKSVRVNITDEEKNDVAPSEIVDKDNNIVVFENLKSNTLYNITLDNVLIDNVQYDKVYTIFKSLKTLKKTPYISGLYSKVNSNDNNQEENKFIIGINDIIDEDKSIVKYTYYIYEASQITLENIENLTVAKTITRNDDSEVEVKIDEKDIKSATNYKFKVVVEYNDNEKYGEFESTLSDNFILVGVPVIKEFIKDEENSSFNAISGTIVVKDDSCTMQIDGRSCLNNPVIAENGNFILKYALAGTPLDDVANWSDIPVYFKEVIDNETKETTLQAYIKVDSLEANKTYTFNLYGPVDLQNGEPIIKRYHVGSFNESTSDTKQLVEVVKWTKNEPIREDLINVDATIEAKISNFSEILEEITFNLYEGNVKNKLENVSSEEIIPVPLKTIISNNINENFYTISDSEKSAGNIKINTKDLFGISSIDDLKKLTNNKLPEFYTIEITGLKDDTENIIELGNNIYVFKVPQLIRIEENEEIPKLDVVPIVNAIYDENGDIQGKQDDKLGDTTIVGYTLRLNDVSSILHEYFNLDYVDGIVYYACNADINENCSISDAVIATEPIKVSKEGIPEVTLNLSNGTEYSESDEKQFVRGHNYIFRAQFQVKLKIDESGEEIVVDSKYPSTSIKQLQEEPYKAEKYAGTYSIYIHKTGYDKEKDIHTITYKYNFEDPDNTLIVEDNQKLLYYSVDNINDTFDFSTDKDFVIGDKENIVLKNNSEYKISFKRATMKNIKTTTGNYTTECKSSVLDSDIECINLGPYIFDGKYENNEITNNVKFEILTEEYSNIAKIILKDLNESNYNLNRISAYNILLKVDNKTIYDKVYSSDLLKTCEVIDGENVTNYKCIEIDYADIVDNKGDNITVNLTAYYDSGIIDNDFANIGYKTDNKDGYILQNNNYTKKGDYIHFSHTNNNGNPSLLEYASGIYGYVTNMRDRLQILRKIDFETLTFNKNTNNSQFQNILTYHDDIIDMKGQSINNKLLSTTSLESIDNNQTFVFNTVVPQISVSRDKTLIDGAKIFVQHSGFISDEYCLEENEKGESKNYYYIEIYNPENNEEVLKTEKREIDLNSETQKTTIMLEKYLPNTTYNYKIYVNKKEENSCKKIYLYDKKTYEKEGNYSVSEYSFSTLLPSKIKYQDLSNPSKSSQSYLEYKSYSDKSNNIYSIRDLTFTFKSNKNIINNIENLDIEFILEDLEGNEVYTVKKNIHDTEISKVYDIYSVELPIKQIEEKSQKEFSYGPNNYKIKIYSITKYNNGTEETDARLLLAEETVNLNNSEKFTELREPEIVINKPVNYIDGTNYLAMNVQINDPDKVIKNGDFNVRILTNELVVLPSQPVETRNLLTLIENEPIKFEAKIDSQTNQYDITPNTLYYIEASVIVYRNNKEYEISKSKLASTSTDQGVALGVVEQTATRDKITLTFSEGVNIPAIKQIMYSFKINGISSETSGGNKDVKFTTIGDDYILEINPDVQLVGSIELNVSYFIEKDGTLEQLKRPDGTYGSYTYKFTIN